MRKRLQKVVAGLLLAGTAALLPQVAAAQLVTGQAAVENGNVERARQEARADAMRTYVEEQVGVHITSRTETSLMQVVSDRVVASSEGYVQIKRVVSEKESGGVYTVVLDLAADARKLATAVTDIKGQLEAMGRNTSRSGVLVAVTGETGAAQLNDLNVYLQAKLENIGFEATVNDTVRAYLSGKNMADPRVGAEARRLARNNRGPHDNALLRGTLQTLRRHIGADGCTATVAASFELVGLDSDTVNSYMENVTATGATLAAAETKACNEATRRAAEALGQKALQTVQGEYQGGQHHLETVISIDGITDRTEQRAQVLAALGQLGVSVLRSSFNGRGQLVVAVDALGYTDLSQLTDDILREVGDGLAPANDDEGAYGSTRLYFSF